MSPEAVLDIGAQGLLIAAKLAAPMLVTALVVGFANSSFEILAGIGVFAALGFMASASGVAVGDVATNGIGLAFIAFPTIISEAPAGTLIGEVQDDALANYAHKLNKDEARLDFSRPAVELERLIRAFHPWPICHTTLNGDALKVHAAELGEGSGAPGTILAADKNGLTVACGEGALRLTRLQLPGGKPLAFSDLYNSRREQFAPGLVLGQ